MQEDWLQERLMAINSQGTEEGDRDTAAATFGKQRRRSRKNEAFANVQNRFSHDGWYLRF